MHLNGLGQGMGDAALDAARASVNAMPGGGPLLAYASGLLDDKYSTLKQWCDDTSVLNPVAGVLCLPTSIREVGGEPTTQQDQTMYGSLPAPQLPSLIVTSANDPNGAVFAGNDASGNPVYVRQQTPQENQSQNAAATLTAIQQEAQNPDIANGCGSSVFDYLNPDCNGLTATLIWGAAALAVVLYVTRK